jgi:DNA modification methylase
LKKLESRLKVSADFSSVETTWPAIKIALWPLTMLTPYDRNARAHTDADVDKVAASMKKWGITFPILVDETGRVIAGHLRLLAAKKLELLRVPVIVARGWSEAEKRAYVIADNQLAARATWNNDLLHGEVLALAAEGFDLNLLGFEAIDLKKLLKDWGDGGAGDPDAIPDVPEQPVSRLGDTWKMDGHRVHCGDSTDAAAVAAAIGDLKPHLMVTDPPYGIEYDPTRRGRSDRRNSIKSTGKVLNDDRADWRQTWALFPGCVAYVWHGALHGAVVAQSLEASGFVLRAQIIWAKQHFTFGRGDYHWRHETCLYAVRKGSGSHWNGDRKQSTVWEVPNNNPFGNANPEQVWGHGTQKPVEIMRRPIINNSKPGDVVYDGFLGSGSTAIAAEMTGRRCVGLELSRAYTDVIVRRWQDFTGRQARLEATGQTFAEVMADRLVEVADGAHAV